MDYIGLCYCYCIKAKSGDVRLHFSGEFVYFCVFVKAKSAGVFNAVVFNISKNIRLLCLKDCDLNSENKNVFTYKSYKRNKRDFVIKAFLAFLYILFSCTKTFVTNLKKPKL